MERSILRNEALIKQLTPKQLRQSVYYSQLLFLVISILLTFIFFRQSINWFNLFVFNYRDIIVFGLFAGIIVVMIELSMYKYLPKHLFDDGGINEKVFKHATIVDVFMIAFVVAICEEILFRGVLQSAFGYIIASTLFVLMHYRYLKKIVLFTVLVAISFFIGYLFELTNNLLVTMMFHFTVDFLLGLYIAKRM